MGVNIDKNEYYEIILSNSARPDYFEKKDDELGNATTWIIPNAQKNIMEPIRLSLKAGGSTYPDNPHEGEEFGYVLKGEIVIVLGKERYKAKASPFTTRLTGNTILHRRKEQKFSGSAHHRVSRHKKWH